MIYKFKKGSFIKGDAQAVGERLTEIREARGNLTPYDVVQEARRETSVLHPHFEWDDEKAAHEHRLNQARRLIQCVILVEHDEHEIKTPVRAFVSITEGSESSYEPVMTVMNDADLREKMLARLESELEEHREKIAAYEELSDVVQGIIDVQEVARKHRKAGHESRAAGV